MKAPAHIPGDKGHVTGWAVVIRNTSGPEKHVAIRPQWVKQIVANDSI